TKKERLILSREKEKLKKVLEGVESLNKLPGALFVVDVKKEDIAVKEAIRLNIPVFAIVDTNCDPDPIDYVIPANDDAVKTIEIITKQIADAIIEGEAKLKEKKAEESAEKERLRKEKEAKREEKKKAEAKEKKQETEAKTENENPKSE
ncbi:MAG: 30S ribosomal protein S2, partial [Ignavibacterium sp.]